MGDQNTHMVFGLTFEAIRYNRPVPHWRCKTPAGDVLEAGVLDGSSRPKMWEALDKIAAIRGEELFIRDFIEETNK